MLINATGVTDVVREDVKDKRSEGRVRLNYALKIYEHKIKVLWLKSFDQASLLDREKRHRREHRDAHLRDRGGHRRDQDCRLLPRQGEDTGLFYTGNS